MEENKVASDNDLHKIAQDIWLLVRNGMGAPHEQMNVIFQKLVAIRSEALATPPGFYDSRQGAEMSGEQAEERTAREGRANEFCDKYRREQKMVGNNGGFYPQQTAELMAAYAESECSRLASRVEELEKSLQDALSRAR